MTRIDPRRLRRALTLQVDPMPDGRRLVTGGETGHVVDPDGIPREACDCPDHRYRGVECAHLLAVRLGRLDPDVRRALQELVA